MTSDYAQNMTDTSKLFDVLTQLKKKYGIESGTFDANQSNSIDAGTLYISPDDIEHCFDKEGKQLALLSIFVHQGKIAHSEIIKLIEKTGLFSAEIVERNNIKNQSRIVLSSTSS
ncbi:DUF2913 family protein [Candidatus Enterovibrio escicola]|uniref:Uncharacterized protein n=1 Tax=Candidatus Enterovibrio escicola TaxID=1927127 RepID=A0A2A5T1R1_9GAMM|nr:DUF2913 family protein [Candidatus Enterovibrio escacola]PCS22105.1 hypothetical protein BTN49_2298 [Candidatus Enterovibrio escacola]